MAALPPIFNPQTTYATGSSPQSVVIGDVNGDGRLDMVSANTGSNTISVLLGNGDGTFQTQSVYAVGKSTGALALGDVNGDGRLDVLTVTVTSDQTSVVSALLGNGDGTFQSPVASASQYSYVGSSIGLADLNGDGRPDLVVPNAADNTLSVLINTGPTKVLSVTASQGSGLVQPGDTVTFTVSVNRAVTVTGGTPTLTLNDGGMPSMTRLRPRRWVIRRGWFSATRSRRPICRRVVCRSPVAT